MCLHQQRFWCESGDCLLWRKAPWTENIPLTAVYSHELGRCYDLPTSKNRCRISLLEMDRTAKEGWSRRFKDNVDVCLKAGQAFIVCLCWCWSRSCVQGQSHRIPPAQQRSCRRVFLPDRQPLHGPSPLGYAQITTPDSSLVGQILSVLLFKSVNWVFFFILLFFHFHSTNTLKMSKPVPIFFIALL